MDPRKDGDRGPSFTVATNEGGADRQKHELDLDALRTEEYGLLSAERLSGGSAYRSRGAGHLEYLACEAVGAMTEKRQSQRISYPCDVQCTGVGIGMSPLNPRISDLSTTGAFIDSMTHIPVGSKVNLSFHLGGRQINAVAEVAHAMPQFGMGVRFVELSEDDRQAITTFVNEP
jgi:PilZ domain